MAPSVKPMADTGREEANYPFVCEHGLMRVCLRLPAVEYFTTGLVKQLELGLPWETGLGKNMRMLV